MTVYVDDFRKPYRGMIMSHMIGDSDGELHAMADAIGVARHHFQKDHYDISEGKRTLAILAGAKPARWQRKASRKRASLSRL